MAEATATANMDAGPGVVSQKRFRVLGFFPPDIQLFLGWLAKGTLSVFTHNFYDLAVLGHPMGLMPNFLTPEGQKLMPGYMAKPEVRGFYASKLGGDIINRSFNIGGAQDKTKDRWGAYFARKIIPGALYCALLGGVYGSAFPAALTSFIITTTITDGVYKVIGENLLGLPHIKS